MFFCKFKILLSVLCSCLGFNCFFLCFNSLPCCGWFLFSSVVSCIWSFCFFFAFFCQDPIASAGQDTPRASNHIITVNYRWGIEDLRLCHRLKSSAFFFCQRLFLPTAWNGHSFCRSHWKISVKRFRLYIYRLTAKIFLVVSSLLWFSKEPEESVLFLSWLCDHLRLRQCYFSTAALSRSSRFSFLFCFQSFGGKFLFFKFLDFPELLHQLFFLLILLFLLLGFLLYRGKARPRIH